MKRKRKCNNEVYQLAKDQALVKKLKNKRFRPFCLWLPDVMFVTRGSKNSLIFVFDFLSKLDCGQWYKLWICQSHPMSAPATYIYIYKTFIRLKIKPNSVRIRSLSLSNIYIYDTAKNCLHVLFLALSSFHVMSCWSWRIILY